MAKLTGTARTKTLAVRLSPKMYEKLKWVSEGYDLAPSVYAYLAIRKALSFNDDILDPSTIDVEEDGFLSR